MKKLFSILGLLSILFCQTIYSVEELNLGNQVNLRSTANDIEKINIIKQSLSDSSHKGFDIDELIEKSPKKEFLGRTLIGFDADIFLYYYLSKSKYIKESLFDINVALLKLQETSAKFSPNLNLGMNYSNANNLSSFTGENEQYLSTTQVSRVGSSAALSILGTNGINYQLGYTIDRNSPTRKNYDSSLSLLSEEDGIEYHSSQLSLDMTVPLAKGWGDVNLASVKQAGLDTKNAVMQTESIIHDLAKQTVLVYWGFAKLFHQVETLNNEVLLSRKIFEETQQRYELGAIDKLSVDEAENRYLLKEQDLKSLMISIKDSEDIIKDAVDMLHVEYGLYPVYPFTLPDMSADSVEQLEEYFELAQNTSPSYKNLKIELDKAYLEESEKKDATDSDINLSLGYTMNGYAENASQSMEDNGFHSYNVGIGWSIPLGTNSNVAQFAQSREKINKLLLQEETFVSNINLDIKSRINNITLLQRKLEIAERTIQLNQSLYGRELEKYRLGASTVSDVSQTQQNLFNANYSFIDMYTQLQSAYLQFNIVVGKYKPLNNFNELRKKHSPSLESFE